MERRTFLASLLGVAAFALPTAGCRDSQTAITKTLSLPQVLSRITDEKTIQALGQAYLTQVPDEADEVLLREKLLDASAGPALSDSEDSSELQAFLEQKIKRDFEEDRLVILDGWVLSQTEARQCALYSLNQS